MSTAPQPEAFTPLPSALGELEELVERISIWQNLLSEILPLLCRQLSARGGIIWLADPQGHLRPAVQEHWQSLNLISAPERAERHRHLISSCVQRRQCLIASPLTRSLSELPAPFTLAFMPVFKKDSLLGVLELVLAKDFPETHYPALIELLEAAAGSLETFTESSQEEFHGPAERQFWGRFEACLLRWYHRLDSRQLAYDAVADAVQFLQVDRVSLLTCFRRRPQLLAISGQAQFSRHSLLVIQLQKLAQEVLATQSPLFHDGRVEQEDSDLSVLLSQYLEQSGTQFLAILPLWSQPDEGEELPGPNQRHDRRRKMVGALVVERSRGSRFPQDRREVLGLIADHLGNALHRAQEQESIFLLPVWRAIGRTGRWLYRHQFWQSVCVLAAVTLLTGSLIVIPWDYRVTGEGQLLPKHQRQIFAPWDAEVTEIFVAGGETVTAGQPLLQLTSKELEGEDIRLRTLIEEKQTGLRALRSARDLSLKAGKRDETVQIEGQLAEFQVEIRNLQLQHQLMQNRLHDLLLIAPLTGVVANFQIRELLLHRPVNRGDLLLEVMDPAGEWQLELQLEDRRIGHMLAARREQKALPVEYILATDPETSFSGTVTDIAMRTQAVPEKGNLVDVRVALHSADEEASETRRPPLRIGAEVLAKISCGPRPLGYVLFGDVIDYVRKKLWW